MYALNNEILRAASKRRAKVRLGRLPRLLAESLLRTWAAVTGIFDGGSASAVRGAGERKTRLPMKKLAPLLALTFILGISAATGCTNETPPGQTEADTEVVLVAIVGQTEADAALEAAASLEAADGQAEADAEEAPDGQPEADSTEETPDGQAEADSEEAPDGQPEADSAEEAPDGQPEADAKPPFTLTTEGSDGLRLARLKAALRILKHGQVTIKGLQTCAATPEAGKALGNFLGRNGKTLVLVRDVIKKNGGETQEIRTLMDREVAAGTAELLQDSDCLALANLVAKNTRDLYKTAELAEDYKLVRKAP